jgi:hypothetical protein
MMVFLLAESRGGMKHHMVGDREFKRDLAKLALIADPFSR